MRMCEAIQAPPNRPGRRSRYCIPARPTPQASSSSGSSICVVGARGTSSDSPGNGRAMTRKPPGDTSGWSRDNRSASSVCTQIVPAAAVNRISSRSLRPWPDITATRGASAGKIMSSRNPSSSRKKPIEASRSGLGSTISAVPCGLSISLAMVPECNAIEPPRPPASGNNCG